MCSLLEKRNYFIFSHARPICKKTVNWPTNGLLYKVLHLYYFIIIKLSDITIFKIKDRAMVNLSKMRGFKMHAGHTVFLHLHHLEISQDDTLSSFRRTEENKANM